MDRRRRARRPGRPRAGRAARRRRRRRPPLRGAPLTVSIGLAASPAGGTDRDALAARADESLYAARAAGVPIGLRRSRRAALAVRLRGAERIIEGRECSGASSAATSRRNGQARRLALERGDVVRSRVHRLAVGDDDVLERELEQRAQRRERALLVPRRPQTRSTPPGAVIASANTSARCSGR